MYYQRYHCTTPEAAMEQDDATAGANCLARWSAPMSAIGIDWTACMYTGDDDDG